MKAPHPAGTAVDASRYGEWIDTFSAYRHSVTEGRIERWIEQFDPDDRDLAARILDSVDFISPEQIRTMLGSAVSSLPGWHEDERQRDGTWAFVAFSGPGKSSDAMLYALRGSLGMRRGSHNDLFPQRHDLLRADFRAEDSVVFVDDFAGTGDQAISAWRDFISELLPNRPKSYLLLVATTDSAIDRIRTETNLELVSSIVLSESDNVFADECVHFSAEDAAALERYGERASRQQPKGYGNSGLLLVFHHTTPNNTIPILHASHSEWKGLFLRDT